MLLAAVKEERGAYRARSLALTRGDGDGGCWADREHRTEPGSGESSQHDGFQLKVVIRRRRECGRKTLAAV